MAKRRDVPTRNEVTERVETSTKEMEEKEVGLDRIATDVEIVRETLEKLDLGGTQEGAEQLESSIEGAEDVTEEVFDREDEDLERMQEENKEFEGELDERRDTSDTDLGKVSDASSKIESKETINELVKAKEAVMRDIDFLKEQIDRATDARQRSDEIQKKHQSRVHSGRGRR